MENPLKNTSDIHHCRCFMMSENDIETCKTKLEKLGFEKIIVAKSKSKISNKKYAIQIFEAGKIEEVVRIIFG